ncbi:metallophosphoesterase family protein [Mesobacillus maritimus]|uniref:Phosphoesterase n=1 Tax=Mesobacillus maritimus TaxID=1643336 RepID=A0ABS7K3B0_9BACI|nr:metallophosphoesterase [Mesobacillus maritimus]MBY0096729.1 metallophosphoesterase [Mesobacillus maritimus]
MKIVVLSDTHIPKKAKGLPSKLAGDLRSADLIIHAGDWQTIEVYHELCQYGKLVGVTGNVDSPELAKRLNAREIIEVEDFRIGVVHGHGTGKTTEKRAQSAFLKGEVNCIVFGHSHIPLLKKEDDVVLFNPGSATDKRRQKQYSYGLITFSSDLKFEHVFYDDKSTL